MNPTELETLMRESFGGFTNSLNTFRDEELNVSPAPGQWSPGQVTRHIIQSSRLLANSLEAPGQPANRPPQQRVPELGKQFLDFNTKFSAAAILLPGDGPFEVAALKADLAQAFHQLTQQAQRGDLDSILPSPFFGEISKGELLYFGCFHSLRHKHQLDQLLINFRSKAV